MVEYSEKLIMVNHSSSTDKCHWGSLGCTSAETMPDFITPVNNIFMSHCLDFGNHVVRYKCYFSSACTGCKTKFTKYFEYWVSLAFSGHRSH